MALQILDSRVHTIVTLRRRGASEDDISAVTALYDSVDAPRQTLLATLVSLEDMAIISALARILPDVREALVKPTGRTAAQIVEEAAKPFLNTQAPV